MAVVAEVVVLIFSDRDVLRYLVRRWRFMSAGDPGPFRAKTYSDPDHTDVKI